MPRELLMMQNSFQWGTAEGQTLEIENAIRSNVRDLKIEGQTYQNLLSETKTLGNYTYDESTGEYTLTNPITGTWNDMNIKYTRPIQAGENLLIRVNFVKNTIESTQTTPVKITYSDNSSTTKGFINVDKGFTGLIEYYCNGAIVNDKYNSKIEITTRNYTSGELVIKDIQVIPVSSNPLGSTELPTSINGVESVAERERNLANYIINAIGTLGEKVVFDNKNCLKITSFFSRIITLPDFSDYKIYICVYANNPEGKIYSIGEFNGMYISPGDKKWQRNTLTANLNKFSLYNYQNTEIYIDIDSLILERVVNPYPLKLTNRGKNLLNISTFRPISYETIQASKDGNVITVKGLKTSDVEAYTDARACNIKVYLEENKTYSFSFKSDGKYGSAVGTDTVEIFFLLDGTTNKYFKVNGQNTFTIPKGFTGYYYVRFDVNSGDKTHKFWDIQVEEGGTVTDYEPYREPTLTEIPLPQPLRSLPNGVRDTVEGNKLMQRVGKIVVDGTNNISIYSIRENTIGLFMTDVTIKNVAGAFDLPFLSDSLEKIRTCWDNDIEGVYQDWTENRFFISISKSKLAGTTIDDVKTYFAENPMTLYYELETPIEHAINIPPISISKGTSMVTTNNNIKPELACKYKQSKKIIKYLYNSGNEYLNITGGWNTQLNAGYGAATTIVKNTNNIYLPSGVWNMLLTNNKIDVTNYDVVYMKYSKEYSPFNFHPARCAIKLGNKNTSWTDFADDATTGTLIGKDETENNVTNGILTIDVSNVTGSYYVGIGGQSNNITVHEIGLKKNNGDNGDTTTLYSNGNENTSLTGGYVTNSNNSATCNIEKQVDNLYVNCTGKSNFDSICYARTNNYIKPCKIKVSVKNNSISANGIAFCVFLSEKEAINSVSDFNSVVNKGYIKASNTTQGQYVDLEIDLTNNARGYLYIACMIAGSAYDCKANIRKIEIIR